MSCVTNGCSGNCCEKFTLPVTLNDIQKMKEEHIRYEEDTTSFDMRKILCDNGFERYPAPLSEIDKLLEMLIPLGVTENCPQDGKTFNELYEKHLVDGEFPDYRFRGTFFVKNGVISSNIFTCKHFDTVERICTNYENRPELCKSFGGNCHYQGCTYVEKKKQEFIEKKEEFNKQLVSQGMSIQGRKRNTEDDEDCFNDCCESDFSIDSCDE